MSFQPDPVEQPRRTTTSRVHPAASQRAPPRMGVQFDNSDREKVREAADIVRVIGEHIALKPKGREYVGLCPFHDDHSPSMGVVPHKQIYKCFSCGASGDVFTFVQRYLKMDFREALEYLAEKFSIKLTPQKAFAFRSANDNPLDPHNPHAHPDPGV
ncbi:MAG TPA: CHC2 zinc finger domain-containing protein, partial [Phycisphaerales bacterium]|nr:CHC2 zinc finger domain-containing protein [Phycisphaerales bacterium]